MIANAAVLIGRMVPGGPIPIILYLTAEGRSLH
jgi:hypothetical protein